MERCRNMLGALGLAVAAFGALSIGPGVQPAAAAASEYELELEAAIEYHFDGWEEDVARNIVACESGFGSDIYNEYSGAYGPWQFLASTSYSLGYDHSLMYDPWYSTAAAEDYADEAGFYPWACY